MLFVCELTSSMRRILFLSPLFSTQGSWRVRKLQKWGLSPTLWNSSLHSVTKQIRPGQRHHGEWQALTGADIWSETWNIRRDLIQRATVRESSSEASLCKGTGVGKMLSSSKERIWTIGSCRGWGHSRNEWEIIGPQNVDLLVLKEWRSVLYLFIHVLWMTLFNVFFHGNADWNPNGTPVITLSLSPGSETGVTCSPITLVCVVHKTGITYWTL